MSTTIANMNINPEILQAFSSLDIEPNALRLYATLCEVGRGSATLLAKRAGFKRTTVYSMLERLEALGLVSKAQRAGALDYIPSGPDAIIRIAENKKAAADKSLAAAKDLARVLRSRQGREAIIKAKVQIFEGQASINAMLRSQDALWRESLMAGNQTWLGFQDDSFFKHYGEWVVEYWKKFSNASDIAQERVFLFSNETDINSQMALKLKKYVKGERIIRPLPTGINFSSGMWVVGDFVIITKIQQNPHVVMVFRDSDLASNLAAVFRFVWGVTA